MPAGIRIPERIVERIRVPVEALRIPRVGDDGIRLQEPSQRGIVRPRAVVVEAQAGLLPLAGEAPIGGQARPCQAGPRHAVGIVTGVAVRDFSPARVRGKGGAAEMVAVEVGQHAALPLGEAPGAGRHIAIGSVMKALASWPFALTLFR